MFNNKSKSESSESPVPSGSASLIGSGTSMKGDITSSGDLRIDGILVGNIVCSAKVIIGANGVVEGDVSGQQADILGKVTGTIRVKELLQLRSNCQVNGNLYSAKLQIEPAATFNGQCHMTQEEAKPLSTGKSSEARKDGFQKSPSLAIS
ncbi:MAG: polymer-forming cytoskeletal protein [Bacteroidota bacterium]|jgi:cytoskeletal protein CcmA (bactofilin family)